MDRLDRKRQQLASLCHWAVRHPMAEVITVADVMTINPTCISPDATVLELVRLFHAKEFRHPLVSDADGNLVGVVSDRDVLRCFGPGRYPDADVLAGVTVGDIMSSDLVTIAPEAPIERAIELIRGYGINCLPVVCNDKLVGILTSTDLYAVLETLLQALRRSFSASPAKTAAANR